MKLGVMQPYFFPYIGYYQLIDHVDQWVVFDKTQYIRKGWVNRNRVLHPDVNKEWNYITVPVRKHDKSTPISLIEINNDLQWKKEIAGKLSHYKRVAPYYQAVLDLLDECFSQEAELLSDFLITCLSASCERLQIDFSPLVFSKMNLNIDDAKHAGQWALNIASALDAQEYVNPPGGYKIFDEAEFRAKSVNLRFLSSSISSYNQGKRPFVSGLSIIDVMMWNSADQIKEMLSRYSIMSLDDMESLFDE